jgi:hypothetical protein
MLNTGSLLGHIQKSTTKNSKSRFEATGVRVHTNQNQSNNFINYTEVKYNLYIDVAALPPPPPPQKINRQKIKRTN